MNLFEELSLPGAYQGGSVSDFYVDASTLDSSLGSPAQAHPATVSPADLWNLDAITSAPASTAFPPLDTPATSCLDSPDLSSDYNTTPFMDENADADLGPNTPLMSLFPEDNFGHFATEPHIASNDSYEFLSELNTTASAAAAQPSPMIRQKSSPGRPPIVHDQKASLSAGIQKANSLKHRKELNEIVIESEDDKETAKRKKNTAAARKSRQRRNETMSAMAAEIARLRGIVKSLGADPDIDFP